MPACHQILELSKGQVDSPKFQSINVVGQIYQRPPVLGYPILEVSSLTIETGISH